MAGALDVVVRFIGDSSKLQDDVSKVEGTGSKIGKWAKGVGVAVGGAFAVNAVKDFIGAAEEANSVSAGLAQSLSNAGDATGEWAKHAEGLADTLMKKTGIDDEVIKGAQTILGTFHDVAGATGQASGAFDRATTAALDMSKAGFGDASSAATMLGKALEDPEKGLTSLGKVGVTFTDAQKEQIKALVASGDKAGAMGKILETVEGQVGGIAEKTATSSDKMNVAFGETQEAVGNALLPVFEALAPILQTVAQFIQDNAAYLMPLAIAVGVVTAAVWLWNAALAANPIVLITIAIAALVAGIIYAYNNFEIFRKVVDAVIGAAVTAFQWLWDVVSSVFGWIVDHWQLLLGILTGPIGIAVMLIVKYWDQIKGAAVAVLDWIKTTFQTIGEWIVKPFQWAWDQIVAIKDRIVDAFNTALGFVKDAWNGFARFWNGVELEVPGVELPGPIPDIPGVTIGLPDLPMFAKGGIVSRATLAMIGERGPEAVIPLDRLPSGVTINVAVTTTGLGADAPAIQRAVVNALRGYTARNGPIAGIAG